MEIEGITTSNKFSLPQAAITLLPHRPPMLLADSLVQREKSSAVALATLPTSGLFIFQATILPFYFIELIAQTAALGNCYDAIKNNEHPRDGMLVGIDAFSWPGQPRPGTVVRITTEKTYEFGPVMSIHGEVFDDKHLLAMGDIKVWENLDED